MSVWRVAAPLAVLLVVVGLVSVIALSGVFADLEETPAPVPTTSATLEVPLAPGPSSEASATADGAESTGTTSAP